MPRPPVETPVSFEVWCLCGRPLRGRRQSTGQIVSCSSCGRKRFILPHSPWPAPAADAAAEQAAGLKLKHLLLAIVLGGTLAMILIFLLVRPYLRRPEATEKASAAPPDCRALLAEGERQFRQGNVFAAAKELSAARAERDRHPNALSRAEYHRLEQLWRQTDLLARLLDRPLEEILHLAMQHRSDEEWRGKFEHYRGRTVLFDDVLRRNAKDRPVLGTYVVRSGGIEARVALEDLTLLQRLPLEPPRRWLFGARLADCRREEGGVWVFRFEPDSAVLLSDEAAARQCCPPPLDEELFDVLKRQDEWLRR